MGKEKSDLDHQRPLSRPCQRSHSALWCALREPAEQVSFSSSLTANNLHLETVSKSHLPARIYYKMKTRVNNSPGTSTELLMMPETQFWSRTWNSLKKSAVPMCMPGIIQTKDAIQVKEILTSLTKNPNPTPISRETVRLKGAKSTKNASNLH